MVWRICWAYLSRTLCAPMSGAFCKLGTAKVPKAEVRVSVKAEAAPLSKEATNNFTSARLSVLPDQRPASVARDTFTRTINLSGTVHFGTGRDNQLAVMKNILSY